MLTSLLSNFWSIFLVVFFFGGSILVHELGHFWAARRRGLKVERFSIGFGPKIVSWYGKDGVEYRLSWIPFGGYVALPQLADMAAIEGDSQVPATPLPEISYSTKMIVFGAGAAMNIVFAFALACIVWQAGVPMSEDLTTTRIGYVSPQIELADGSTVPSPAARAGLQAGDIIRKIDGITLEAWYDLKLTLMTSSGATIEGNPKALLTVERDGKFLEMTVYPQLAGKEGDRTLGVSPGYEMIVAAVDLGTPAEKAGLLKGDRIQSLNGLRILNGYVWQKQFEAQVATGLEIGILREGVAKTIAVPALSTPKPELGLTFTLDIKITHPTPFKQLADQVRQTFRIIGSLISATSNIGLDKVSGPVGIVRVFHSAASAGIIPTLMFTILVNVSLAIFNLLPIPVLDGGHMLFATVGKLRGRPLPAAFIASAQGIFTILLLLMIAYVSLNDVKRIARETPDAPPASQSSEKTKKAEPASPEAPQTPSSAPVPAASPTK